MKSEELHLQEWLERQAIHSAVKRFRNHQVHPLLGDHVDLTPSMTMESGVELMQKSAWHCSVLHNWDAFATSLQAPRRQEAATGGVRPGTLEQCPEDNRSVSVCS